MASGLGQVAMQGAHFPGCSMVSSKAAPISAAGGGSSMSQEVAMRTSRHAFSRCRRFLGGLQVGFSAAVPTPRFSGGLVEAC